MKIHILEQRLLDYRIPIYEKLNKIKDVEVVTYYWENYNDKDFLKNLSPQDISFKVRGVRIINFLNKFFLPLYPSLIYFCKQPNYLIIRGNVRNILIIPILFFRKILGLKTIVWGQGGSRRRDFNPSRNFYDIATYLQMKIADAYIVYDELTKNNLNRYFTDKIFVAKNTLDFDKEALSYEKFSSNISQEKDNLNFESKINLCYIGRLSSRKRLPRLVEMFNLVLDIEPDTTLWIVGDGPESKFIQGVASENSKIKYLGSLYGSDASKILFLCDATLMPGWMGLGVNHSLFFGSPVFSELKNNTLVNHAPEASFIVNNFNGFLNEVNDDKRFIENFKLFLSDRLKYSINARQFALNNLTPDLMVKGVIDSITYISELTNK
jgi:glycosyltransferase involved in cell wall biosynthesis